MVPKIECPNCKSDMYRSHNSRQIDVYVCNNHEANDGGDGSCNTAIPISEYEEVKT